MPLMSYASRTAPRQNPVRVAQGVQAQDYLHFQLNSFKPIMLLTHHHLHIRSHSQESLSMTIMLATSFELLEFKFYRSQSMTKMLLTSELLSEDKSKKAKNGNSKRKFKSRLDRGGWKGIEEKNIIGINMIYLLGCAIQNKETKLYELPPSAVEIILNSYQQIEEFAQMSRIELNN
ncbi:hypothetical protein LXL04_025360 [Taraxacum kok-saghyz]